MSMESIQEEERIFTPDYEDFIYDPMGFKRGVVIGAKKGLVGWALFDEVDDPYFRYHERLEEIPYYVTMLGEEKCGDLLLPPGVQVMEIPASKGVINQVRDMAISRANDDVDKFLTNAAVVPYAIFVFPEFGAEQDILWLAQSRILFQYRPCRLPCLGKQKAVFCK